MPPWKADHGDYEFKSERRLTDAEIDIIQRWVADGMPEGNLRWLPHFLNLLRAGNLGSLI